MNIEKFKKKWGKWMEEKVLSMLEWMFSLEELRLRSLLDKQE